MIILIKDCLTELVRTGSSADRYADHLLPADTAETGRRRSIEGERKEGGTCFAVRCSSPVPPRDPLPTGNSSLAGNSFSLCVSSPRVGRRNKSTSLSDMHCILLCAVKCLQLGAKWFPPAEASLKRSVIRKLIYELLNDCSEKIDPKTCSTGCPLTSGHTKDNTEQEQQVELLSAHCSPAMGVMGDAICQDTEDGEKLDAVEDSQEADTTKTERMVPSATGPVDREDGGHELDTNEAGGEDGKDCGETTSNAVRQDNKSSVIHITEVESGDGSCQENRPSFEGVIITVDGTPSDDNDDVQVTRKKPVQKPRKRGKVMIPQGRRVRTQSVTKEQHNDT
ncbi:hypothetical protein GW17_00048989 [Ensete ventricosum]|nr:hypothetical protein GW17_00048989 [Ensete ventricosum]